MLIGRLLCFYPADLKSQIDSLAKEYTSNARTLSSEQKLSILRQIQQSYSKCKEFGDDKVQLAMQTYEMVSTTTAHSIHYANFFKCWTMRLRSNFFCRSTSTSGVWTQTWPGLRLTWRRSRLRAPTMIPPPVRERKVCEKGWNWMCNCACFIFKTYCMCPLYLLNVYVFCVGYVIDWNWLFIFSPHYV